MKLLEKKFYFLWRNALAETLFIALVVVNAMTILNGFCVKTKRYNPNANLFCLLFVLLRNAIDTLCI